MTDEIYHGKQKMNLRFGLLGGGVLHYEKLMGENGHLMQMEDAASKSIHIDP